jgi:hypothetical protein
MRNHDDVPLFVLDELYQLILNVGCIFDQADTMDDLHWAGEPE